MTTERSDDLTAKNNNNHLPEQPKTIVFVETLDLRTLFYLILHKDQIERVYVFRASRWKGLNNFLHFIRLLKTVPVPIRIYLADVRDAEGRCIYPSVFSDASGLSEVVRQTEFDKNEMVERACLLMGNRQAVMLFLEKLIYQDIFEVLSKAHMAKWYFTNVLQFPRARCVLLVPNRLWWSHVSGYTTSVGVHLIRVGSADHRSIWPFISLRLVRGLAHGMREGLRAVFKASGRPGSSPKIIESPTQQTKIATDYLGTPVSFDEKKRSTFLWMINSGLQEERVSLFRSDQTFSMSDEELMLLKNKRIQLINLSKEANVKSAIRVLLDRGVWVLLMELIRGVFTGGYKKFRTNVFCFEMLLRYSIYFTFWRNLFQRYGIRMLMTSSYFDPFHIPKHCAVKSNKGISLSYQWSNLEINVKTISICCDMYFGFSEMYKRTLYENGSLMGAFLPTGYITDYGIKSVKENAAKLRSTLTKNGANFILCF
ncbi:MAG: hypothetical protein IPP35_08650 [Elusimicrobia bacterium]|nr:hypothetical protein [Elusimicrobiota bacterium]